MKALMEEEEALNTVLPVGRYQGKKLREVPEDDLFYLFRNDPELLQYEEAWRAITCVRAAIVLRRRSGVNGCHTERSDGREG